MNEELPSSLSFQTFIMLPKGGGKAEKKGSFSKWKIFELVGSIS